MKIGMTVILYSILDLVFPFTLHSQSGPPDTEIYLLDLSHNSGEVSVGTPRNITNREGYDNQPHFLPSGEAILYTAIGADGQADIYQYSLVNQETTRLTKTQESEYSPTPLPDGKHFSTVRVEADSSQRLWRFPLSGGAPSLILPDIEPVGYHAWGSSEDIALFVLGDPNMLYLAKADSGKADKILGPIGRSLHKIPSLAAISFVHKASEDDWWIKQLDLRSRKIQPLVRTLSGKEDYTWTPNGLLLMGSGSRLFRCNPDKETEWTEIADFEKHGLTNISRLAVSQQGARLAIVSSR